MKISPEQADKLYEALMDLVARVDTTPVEDGSNLDTAQAHAVLDEIASPVDLAIMSQEDWDHEVWREVLEERDLEPFE